MKFEVGGYKYTNNNKILIHPPLQIERDKLAYKQETGLLIHVKSNNSQFSCSCMKHNCCGFVLPSSLYSSGTC